MRLRESGAVRGQFLLEAKTGLAAGPGAEAAAEAKPSGVAGGAGPGEEEQRGDVGASQHQAWQSAILVSLTYLAEMQVISFDR